MPEFGIDQGLLEQCDNWWWRDTAELANEMAIDAPAWPGTANLSVVAGPGAGAGTGGGGFDESGTGVFDERRE